MSGSEEIKSRFSELFPNSEKGESTAKNSYWWQELSDEEKEKRRFQYYREQIRKKWEVYSSMEHEGEEEYHTQVYVQHLERESNIGNQYLFWKLRYLENNNYVDRVEEKLEREYWILFDRKNTELKYRLPDKNRTKKWTERRFWKPTKDGLGCEVFVRYGRNKRFDLLGNDEGVLVVENKKSVVLKTLRLIWRNYTEIAPYIEQRWIDKLKNDFTKKILSQKKFNQRYYCYKDETINNGLDLIKYKKRTKAIEELYGCWIMTLYGSFRYKGEYDLFDDWEYEESSGKWICKKVRKELLEVKNDRIIIKEPRKVKLLS